MLMLLLLLFAADVRSHKLEFRVAYQGQRMSDAFSSIHVVAGGGAPGVLLAGKRSSTPTERIFRSADGGQTWASVGPIAGYTGAHTYWFGSGRNGTVLTGTGDVGSPAVLRSQDYGSTWKVVLNASQIIALAGGVDPGAAYSPLLLDNNNNGWWLLSLRSANPGKHFVQSQDDGLTWSAFSAPDVTSGARKMIRTSDGRILYSGTFPDSGQKSGLFVSANNGASWNKTLENEGVFAGLEDVGNGVYLVGSYAIGPTAIHTASRAREGGVAVITTSTAHGMGNGTKLGIYGMSDSSFDARPFAEVVVVNSTTLAYASEGPDTPETADTNGRLCRAATQKIFRSTDYGNTWAQVATTTVYSSLTYIRTIVHVGNGVVYAFACANENSWGDRALATYKSLDFGKTWSKIPDSEEYVGQYGRLNAVYEAVVYDGKLFAATQPDSAILVADIRDSSSASKDFDSSSASDSNVVAPRAAMWVAVIGATLLLL